MIHPQSNSPPTRRDKGEIESVADKRCKEEENAGSDSHATVLSGVADEGGDEEETADSCEGEAGKVERGVVEDVVVVPEH